MGEDRDVAGRLSGIVASAEEFDLFAAEAMPELLDRATGHTKRFLKETGQWENDIAHEKLALRWGYELVERFLVCGRSEVPCRPLFLLDSLIAKYYSQPDPLCYHKDLLSPLGRFLDGLTSRAVVSRDALMALFYHLYGFGQGQVVKILGLGMAESQRVYKNFERWRQSGWQRAVEEIGLTEDELHELEEQKQRHPERVNAETERLIHLLQTHYRKSEPEHYPCLSRQKWDELFGQDYGYDYRVWHLAMCRDCFVEVCDLRYIELNGALKPRIDLHIRPRQKGGVVAFFLPEQGGGRRHGTGRPAQRISPTSA
ncbi:MAG TPA: hypothetical protein VNK46_01275 [Nitrospiraceae bacterium]|jgi:hypothetical protein|nr:hypothetical protein [Nitrospiraceae bacterium]